MVDQGAAALPAFCCRVMLLSGDLSPQPEQGAHRALAAAAGRCRSLKGVCTGMPTPLSVHIMVRRQLLQVPGFFCMPTPDACRSWAVWPAAPCIPGHALAGHSALEVQAGSLDLMARQRSSRRCVLRALLPALNAACTFHTSQNAA